MRYEIRELDIELSQKGFAYYDKKKEYEKEQLNINEKRDIIHDDLVKLAGSEAPLLILEKQLDEINSQSKRHNSSLNQSIVKDKINDLIHSFKEFSEKNCSDQSYLDKFNKFSDDFIIKENNDNLKQYLLKDLNPYEINFY